jgi:hypothetical protein
MGALPESGRKVKIGVTARLSERRGWADHPNRSILRGTMPPGNRPLLPRGRIRSLTSSPVRCHSRGTGHRSRAQPACCSRQAKER